MGTLRKYKLAPFIVVLAAILEIVLAVTMDMSVCPDEGMRYPISEWISQHGTLPTGYEESLINPAWGYSYAFTPYLPQIIGALFLKLTSLFTDNAQALLFSCRLISIFSGIGISLLSFRIADRFFENKYSVYFMASLVTFLPQLVFICSYLNNDALSVFSAFMIFDAVLTGSEKGWGRKTRIYLALGTSICILTYYFAYAWVLFAIGGYFITALKNTQDRKVVFKNAGLIALTVFVLAGWYFIRNAIIYDGDFLGISQNKICAAMTYEKTGVYPQGNPGGNHMSMHTMLYEGGWISTTTKSFLGLFSVMCVKLKERFYFAYRWFLRFCLILFFVYRNKTRKKISTTLLLSMLFVMAVPVVLSVFSSYYRDFQPQGRYVMSMLPAVSVIFTAGVDAFSVSKSGKFAKLLPALMGIIWFLIFAVIYYAVMLPTLSAITLPGAGVMDCYEVM